ncbi:MAG: type II toxin-antitoxin system RelE/ParE family toxin [Bacteroidetes bacterium]|nr:type II toxin-antitoxin system RelE/ParE family toxin [Bacteroidota bacterium]MBU2585757.1 type II toxin-antitoxin system RelE/ParE family toxin [Bacteroidota bacterium]
MTTRYKKSFLKDFEKLNESMKTKIVQLVFAEVPSMLGTSELKSLKKIRDEKNYFRLRVGDYRIGLKIENDIIIFYRVMHRKDIYRFFPS